MPVYRGAAKRQLCGGVRCSCRHRRPLHQCFCQCLELALIQQATVTGGFQLLSRSRQLPKHLLGLPKPVAKALAKICGGTSYGLLTC